MNKHISGFAIALMGAIFFSAPVAASPLTEQLITCTADSTTGKERKELAQWVFFAMAAHPEIQPFSKVTTVNREELDKRMAALVTKLITVNCRAEAKAAVEKEGNAALEAAFGSLGKLAMQELTSDPAVKLAFGTYASYLDKAEFERVFSKK